MSTISKDKRSLKDFRSKVEFILNNTHLDNPYESEQDKQARIKRAKSDYKFFVEYYFPHLAKTATPEFHIRVARKIRRKKRIKIWLKWGRGHAKSVLADILIVLWLLINEDIKFLVLIGENQDKAEILLEDLRAELEGNQKFIHDFGEQKNLGQWEKGFFITKGGFIAKALGMGQSPRGLRVGPHRPDYIACDDWENRQSAKNPKRQDEMADWLLRDVLPTADDGNRRVVLAQNHSNPRMIFSKIIEENEAWEVDQVNAYHPGTYESTWKDKYEPEHWMEIEQEMGVLAANAEYNNDPHVEGKIFTDDMIQWGSRPRIDHFKAVIGIWDVAWSNTATADFNAVRVWGLDVNGKKWLIDCFVKQTKIKSAIEWIADFQKNSPRKVEFKFEEQFHHNESIIETIQEVEQKVGFRLNVGKLKRSTVRKYDRMLEMHPDYQQSKIFYSDNLKHHNDTKVGLAQLKAIEPNYKTKDDAPDADQYAFKILDKFKKKGKHRTRMGKRERRRF